MCINRGRRPLRVEENMGARPCHKRTMLGISHILSREDGAGWISLLAAGSDPKNPSPSMRKRLVPAHFIYAIAHICRGGMRQPPICGVGGRAWCVYYTTRWNPLRQRWARFAPPYLHSTRFGRCRALCADGMDALPFLHQQGGGDGHDIYAGMQSIIYIL